MNGQFVASRAVSIAKLLLRFEGTLSDPTKPNAAGIAALKGAAAAIQAMEPVESETASAYNTAMRGLLVSMVNTLEALTT